jgi:Domain of unknown function (DUF4303)
MTKAGPSQAELVEAVTEATRAAATELFQEHPGDHFYYFSLTTTGEVLSPTVTAWSKEALDQAVEDAGDDPSARPELKWSYADSPFYGYGDQHFDDVRRLFDALDGDMANEVKMDAMVKALKRLDQEGVFGRGAKRDGLVLNVEFMPPDHSNVERARSLNPPAALIDWLKEAAEP